MRERERPTLAQALARFEKRKKYASMAHELRQAQTRRNGRNLYNDLQRVEGVLHHRLREGTIDHAQFATQEEKLQRATREAMFDT